MLQHLGRGAVGIVGGCKLGGFRHDVLLLADGSLFIRQLSFGFGGFGFLGCLFGRLGGFRRLGGLALGSFGCDGRSLRLTSALLGGRFGRFLGGRSLRSGGLRDGGFRGGGLGDGGLGGGYGCIAEERRSLGTLDTPALDVEVLALLAVDGVHAVGVFLHDACTLPLGGRVARSALLSRFIENGVDDVFLTLVRSHFYAHFLCDTHQLGYLHLFELFFGIHRKMQ